MAHSFDELCEAVCQPLGIALPQARTDARGATILTLEFEEVALSLLHAPEEPDTLVILAALGAPQPGQEARAMQTLLDANFLLLGYNAPAFSRNADTGEFFLQSARRLTGCTPEALRQSLRRLVHLARVWRSDALTEETIAQDGPGGYA